MDAETALIASQHVAEPHVVVQVGSETEILNTWAEHRPVETVRPAGEREDGSVSISEELLPYLALSLSLKR